MPHRELTVAKRTLGIDRLILQVHDASFPSDPDEDFGRGSPYSRGADRLFAFADRLGFDAIQLGPQGLTQRGNPSPYDATLFSRNPLNLPLSRMVEQGRLRRETLAQLVELRRSSASDRETSYVELYDRFQVALQEIVAGATAADRNAARDFAKQNEYWLIPDALYVALCDEHAEPWWGNWGRTPLGRFDQRLFAPTPGEEAAASRRIADLRRQYERHVEDYAFVQWLLEGEHQSLRRRLAALGLTLWADLQVGLAPQDAWARQSLFLRGYRMGAPPSRTNPAGQPWGYAVYDPRQLGTIDSPGPALEFARRRLDKVLSECDGVRIDHPHGWVDPWVYRADDPDPFHAVQNGARLFSSPADSDHAELAPFAIARESQLDRSEPRHADRRVTQLDDTQVAQYSLLVDLIVARAQALGRSPRAIACEVLSTLPYPIQRVLERHGLGRFRVVQKAKLHDPSDVYRIEHAEPRDWIMLGTHDTPTIWELAERWCVGPEAADWSRYLASLGTQLPESAGVMSSGPLVHAIFQAILTSRARHVMVFFADLFGMKQRYNEPGVISESNWRLGLSSDFETAYESNCRSGAALDIVACLKVAASRSRMSDCVTLDTVAPATAASGPVAIDTSTLDDVASGSDASSSGGAGSTAPGDELVPLVGATIDAQGNCVWRVWAPRSSVVELILCDEQGRVESVEHMKRRRRSLGVSGGTPQSAKGSSRWFEFSKAGVRNGQRYLFQLDGRPARPDPASRWQPDGVHRPSAVWNPRSFAWTDGAWRGVARDELVIYELHVGTFTPEGTFAAIRPRLQALRELGVTAIELMPVAQFPGSRGWGYDGTYWFAPQNSYGGPSELQRLVDACHAEGLAVILDVVYNHLGPEGNYLGEFGPYFTDRHHTAWGPAINFDGQGSDAVRAFVLDNVRHWIRDFHIDGLRLDAVHALVDDSPTHILTEIKRVADDEAARAMRHVHVIAESHLNDVRMLEPPAAAGYGLDAQWSDDFHHCVHALLTGERDGYYVDYSDPARQLAKALNDVFVYDGCFSPRFGKPWGRPIRGQSGDRFVVSIQTHDQVGNRPFGDRFGTLLDPPRQRLAAGLLLLAPNIPLLFMGEEYGETRPFPFFCDFGDPRLRDEVSRGRRHEFAAFYHESAATMSAATMSAATMSAATMSSGTMSGETMSGGAMSGGTSGLVSRATEPPDPNLPETFQSAILSWNWTNDRTKVGLRALYAALLDLRRQVPALRDFTHRSARLLSAVPRDAISPPFGASATPSILLLERGDPQRPESVWRAVFNLNAFTVRLPPEFEPFAEFAVHSEEDRFGGTSDEDAFGRIMPPYSFGLSASRPRSREHGR